MSQSDQVAAQQLHGDATAAPPTTKRAGASFAQRYGGLLLLGLILVAFSVLEPDKFPTYSNFTGVLANQAIGAIVALGLIAPLAAGVFDLSIAGVMTFSVVGVTYLFQTTHGHIPILVAIAITLLVALVTGLVNSALTIRLSVDPFIATMGTGFILTGLSQLIANGTTITLYIPPGFTDFGRMSVWGIPIFVFVFVGLAAIVWYLLTLTPLGPTVYATGAAREASRLAGIRTNRVIVLAFCSSAVGAAIAGVLFAAQTGSGPPRIGDGYLLGSYAAAFLGSTMIRPGRFNVGGLVVATLIIAFSVNGLELVGTAFWVTGIFQGFALLFAVALPKIRKRRTLV